MTFLNVALQLVAISFASYDAYKVGKDKFLNEAQFKILLTVLTCTALIFDQIEQHYKDDNLRRREEQLNQGIKSLGNRLS